MRPRRPTGWRAVGGARGGQRRRAAIRRRAGAEPAQVGRLIAGSLPRPDRDPQPGEAARAGGRSADGHARCGDVEGSSVDAPSGRIPAGGEPRSRARDADEARARRRGARAATGRTSPASSGSRFGSSNACTSKRRAPDGGHAGGRDAGARRLHRAIRRRRRPTPWRHAATCRWRSVAAVRSATIRASSWRRSRTRSTCCRSIRTGRPIRSPANSCRCTWHGRAAQCWRRRASPRDFPPIHRRRSTASSRGGSRRSAVR